MKLITIRKITAIVVLIAFTAGQPVHAQPEARYINLAVDPVCAVDHMTGDDADFAYRLRSDSNLLCFALTAYRIIITEKRSFEELSGKLEKLPFWKDFWVKSVLEVNFVQTDGG